jgi:CRISPR-associated endonuclease Cas2
MKMKRFRIGKQEQEIIKLIGLGILVSGSLILPNLPQALKFYKSSKNTYYHIKRIINKLRSKNLIILSGEKIYLSKKGQEIAKKIEIEEIIIERTNWDGLWRIVAWDIPEKYKKERDFFRKTLDNLGFYRIQASMWAIPFECKQEVAIIAQHLRLSPYIMHLTTDKLPNQNKLIQIFNL